MKEELIELLDQRYDLEQLIAGYEKQLAELTNDIVCMMADSGLKEAQGSNGISYTVSTTTRYEYRQQAYDYLNEKGLLGYFLGKPRITQEKLKDLIKDERLSYADMAEIERYITSEQSPYFLRKKGVK